MWIYVLSIIGGLAAMFLFVVYLPAWIHYGRIRYMYGGVREKRAIVKHLIDMGVITHIGFLVANLGPGRMFIFIVHGPFGVYVRRSSDSRDGTLITETMSAVLPPVVVPAFDGYLERADDIVRLLWGCLDTIDEPKRFHVGGDPPTSLALVPAGQELTALRDVV